MQLSYKEVRFIINVETILLQTIELVVQFPYLVQTDNAVLLETFRGSMAYPALHVMSTVVE